MRVCQRVIQEKGDSGYEEGGYWVVDKNQSLKLDVIRFVDELNRSMRKGGLKVTPMFMEGWKKIS